MEALRKHKDAPPPPPVHVAIIMDGNGRWARKNALPVIAGHRRGADSLREVVKAAKKSGISYLTVYGFSSENWGRPVEEVRDLMGLLRLYLRKEIADLHKNGVRFRVIGDRQRLKADIVALIEEGEEKTRENTQLTLVVALSYGSRAEILGAVRKLAEKAAKGEISAEEISEEMFTCELETRDIPDPDLLIRTSGELRLSNFLLWQSAYTELVFTDKLWPEFGAQDLALAVEEFHRRERRYGTSHG